MSRPIHDLRRQLRIISSYKRPRRKKTKEKKPTEKNDGINFGSRVTAVGGVLCLAYTDDNKGHLTSRYIYVRQSPSLNTISRHRPRSYRIRKYVVILFCACRTQQDYCYDLCGRFLIGRPCTCGIKTTLKK